MMGAQAPIGYNYVYATPAAYVSKGTQVGTIQFVTLRNTPTNSLQVTDNISVDATQYHTYMIQIDTDGVEARLYVDDVLVATHDIASSDAASPYFFIQTGADYDAVLRIDFVAMFSKSDVTLASQSVIATPLFSILNP